MHLTVLSNLETKVFFVINDITIHNGFWAQSMKIYALRWEET